MTLLTFTQVVLRYGFNTGFVWALEATDLHVRWLILFGISYCVRVHAHSASTPSSSCCRPRPSAWSG